MKQLAAVRFAAERKKDEYSAYWRFRQTDGQHDPETEEGRSLIHISDGEYTDVDAYKESVKETLIKNKEDSRDSEIKSDILSQISANSTVRDYPQEMLDYGLTNMQNAYKQMASQYDMEYADLLQNYFGMTEEQFNEEALNVVKQNLDAEMYLKAIAEKEGIEVSDDDYEAACQRYADTYGYDSVDDL